jgi:hypothetical protein
MCPLHVYTLIVFYLFIYLLILYLYLYSGVPIYTRDSAGVPEQVREERQMSSQSCCLWPPP